MEKKDKILIVDDEQINLKTYSKILEDAGYETLTALSGTEALDKATAEKPSLILLDRVLGEEDGLDVLKKMKSEANEDLIYVVMMSGLKTSGDEQATGLELGADGYLTKPLEKRELIARIDAFIRHRSTLELLKKSENQFRKIIEKNPDALLIVDTEGSIKFANPAAENLFKLTLDKLFSIVFGYPVITHEHTEIEILRHDDSARIAEMRTVDIEWEERKSFLTSMRDITKSKKAQHELKANAEIIEAMNDFFVDREFKLIELKKEVNSLLKRLGQPEKYNIVE